MGDLSAQCVPTIKRRIRNAKSFECGMKFAESKGRRRGCGRWEFKKKVCVIPYHVLALTLFHKHPHFGSRHSPLPPLTGILMVSDCGL